MKTLIALSLATLALIAAALPADAASRSTARVTTREAIHSGPAEHYRVIGKLDRGEVVHLRECTYHQRWCYVLRDGDGPDGWVDGGYLIGAGAKNEVTPWDFLVRPFGSSGSLF